MIYYIIYSTSHYIMIHVPYLTLYIIYTLCICSILKALYSIIYNLQFCIVQEKDICSIVGCIRILIPQVPTTTHYTLHTTHYPLHYTLPTTHYTLPTTLPTTHYTTLHYPLPTTHYTTHYPLHNTLHYTLPTTHYVLSAMSCAALHTPGTHCPVHTPCKLDQAQTSPPHPKTL